MQDFLSLLNSYSKEFDTQSELAEEMTKRSKELYEENSKTYNRFILARFLKGKQFIERNDYESFKNALYNYIAKNDLAQLDDLYSVYTYQYHMNDEQQETVRKVNDVFKAFQKLSTIKSFSKRSTVDEISILFNDNGNERKDGLFYTPNERERAIIYELMNEFSGENPHLDVFIPIGLHFYYEQILKMISSNYGIKNISIRQILTFPKNNERHANSSKDLLNILPSIYSMIYSGRGCQFYYAYSNASIEEIDSLIFPFYIVMSECIIRFSQDTHTVWVSHNQDDVLTYQRAFEEILTHKNVKQLVQHYNMPTMLEEFAQPECSCHTGYTPFGHYVQVLDDDDLDLILATDLPSDQKAGVHDFIHSFDLNKGYSFFNKHNLYKFADDGIFYEYPRALTRKITPVERKKILTNLYQLMKSEKCNFYIVNSDYFNTNDDFVICLSDRYVVTYPAGMPDNEICSIGENTLVSSFKYYFQDYLPHSNMIYSRKEALDFIQEAIEIADKKQYEA